MPFSFSALSLGSLSLHRTAMPDTISAYISLRTDPAQFRCPEHVLRASSETGMDDHGDILVGELSAGITFFDPIPAGKIGLADQAPDIADRFNDQINFHVRATAITSIARKYFNRLAAPMNITPVRGFVFIEEVRASPGFCEMDVLAAGLKQVELLTAASSEGLLWIHSAQDTSETRTCLYRAMSDQLAFKRAHPEWMITTFPSVGPIAGTMAGILAPAARWKSEDDWAEVSCTFETDPDWISADIDLPEPTHTETPCAPDHSGSI